MKCKMYKIMYGMFIINYFINIINLTSSSAWALRLSDVDYQISGKLRILHLFIFGLLLGRCVSLWPFRTIVFVIF